MCRVTVNCCCRGRSNGGGLGVLAVVVLGLLAAPAVLVALTVVLDLVTALVIGVVAAVGVVVIGWIVKTVAVAAIEEWSLRRHNERMAQLYPHLRAQIRPGRHTATPPTWSLPTSQQSHAVAAAPVQIYPTPRAELAACRGRGAV